MASFLCGVIGAALLASASAGAQSAPTVKLSPEVREFVKVDDAVIALSHIRVIGKQADLVVVRGDPSSRISDIENVEIVFKDGVGYDPAKLIGSVRGLVGLR